MLTIAQEDYNGILKTINKVRIFFFIHDTVTCWMSSTFINVLNVGPEGIEIESSLA